MTSPRTVLIARILLAGLVAALASLGHAQKLLTIWGQSLGPDSQGLQAVVREYERRHPAVRVRMLSMGAGHMNPQKVMTAIVGRVPPDLIFQGRFNISDYASHGAFVPLDGLIRRDRAQADCPREEEYFKAAWDEAKYEGRIYGIPTGADDRALYWNRTVFRANRERLAAEGLDWQRPPRTWSELLRYAKALTIPGKTLGFIPNFGNSWFYIYAFQNNAYFLSPDGQTVTLTTPEAEEALTYMVRAYDAVGGYEKAKAFEASFGRGENDPFVTGQVAMKIDGDWTLSGLARFAPSLDFGTAPPPVPDDRYHRRGRFKDEPDRFVTWIGGFSYVIPTGAKHPEEAWAFIKFATSPEGRMTEARAQADWERQRGRVYIPRIQGHIASNEAMFREFIPKGSRFGAALRTHLDLMKVARTRPPTTVGQLLWDEHVRAMERAALKVMTPAEALRESEEVVQNQLDTFSTRTRHPIIDLRIPAALFGLLGLTVVAWLARAWSKQRLGRLRKHEAVWAYLFVSPWLAGFLVFVAGPMLASLFLCFTEYDVLSPPRWVGLRNFADMGGLDRPNILKAFANAAYIGGIGVPLGIASGLAVALLLNAAARGIRFYRTMFYMPAIVPGIAATTLWMWLLNSDPKRGLVNAGWEATLAPWFGLAHPEWLGAEAWAKPALVMMGLWGVGAGMVLWLAALKGVPTTLYEAASLDGASSRQQFWSVTFPHLTPVLFFNVVMGVIGSLQEFDRVYVMTGGLGNGPNDTLLVPVKHLFTNGFAYFKMGYASALAWLVFGIVIALTFGQFRLARRWVRYEGK